MDATQGSVLVQLSVTARIHLASRGLPQRSRRGARAWRMARKLLHRLLLGADGPFVRGGGNESVVDRRACNPCVAGESHPVRSDHRTGCRSYLHSLGRVDTAAASINIGTTISADGRVV